MEQFDTKLLYIKPVPMSTVAERRLGMPAAPRHPFKSSLFKLDAQDKEKSKNDEASENTGVVTINNEALTNKHYSRKLNSMYRAKVMDAYYNRRIFVVYGYNNILRRSLLQRGWLEKLVPGRYEEIKSSSDEILTKYAREGNDYEAVAISRIINDLPAFFVWQFRRQPNLFANVQPYRNVIRRNRTLDFTTKIGLIGCTEQEHWYCGADGAGKAYPRFYRLGANDEEVDAFVDDFRRTQVFSLLRYVQDKMKNLQDLIDRDRGLLGFGLFKQAVNLVQKWMEGKEDNMSVGEWNDFICESNKIIRDGAKLRVSVREFHDFIKIVQPVWRKLENCRAYNWDGCRNVWILKPGYMCRGSGIVLRDTLNGILEFTRVNATRRYIAQKYIERPFLVYNTKFDIRQYMLLCIGIETIKIWLYRDCYLKFSSQIYKLDDLAESIHLTNNSVQKYYENDKQRDSRLPTKNMWSLSQFQGFLQSEGHDAEKIWEQKIFNGFRNSIIPVVLASIEDTELIPNTFELYGVDFMLDEQLNPILLEINATPDLSPSTEVTAHLCPMVIKDLVRVIVDLPRDRLTSTGLFELVYEKNYHFNENTTVAELNVNGKQAMLHPRDYRKIPLSRAERICSPEYLELKNSVKRNWAKSATSLNTNENVDNISITSSTKKTKKVKKFRDPKQTLLAKKIRSIHEGAETNAKSKTIVKKLKNNTT